MSAGLLFEVPKTKLVQIDKVPTKRAIAKITERGCAYCPSNKTKGIKKLKTKVKGRSIMIVTSAPSMQENKDEKLLVGSSGDFFWDELKKVGLSRADVDIQAAMRCFPADKIDGSLVKREANKEEIRCCSKYNDKAKEESKAKVYIVLGALAHKAFLGKEYKKSKRIFWSETLKAKVYCLVHPGFFLLGHHSKLQIDEFREALKAVSTDISSKTKISQYSYIEKQNYVGITKISQGIAAVKHLLQEAKNDISITADIEYDIINGKTYYLCCGFSWKPGHAYVFVLDHPKVRKIGGKWKPLHPKVRRIMHKLVAKILTSGRVAKVLHQGNTDISFIKKVTGVQTKNYSYDTIYAEFLAFPDRRAYGLANIALQRYPQFGNYKTVILPECIPPDIDLKEYRMQNVTDLDKLYDWAGKSGNMHFSYLPLKKLILRNGADADITKRIELSTRKKVNKALLRVYMDAAFILAAMEPNGPDFDYVHCQKIKQIYPPRLETVKDKLCQIAGRADFNPSAPQQVYDLLYVKLKIKPPEIAFDKKKKKKKDTYGNIIPPKAGTGKLVLEVLGRKYEIARLIAEYRKLSKMISTYINSFEDCANQNFGKLATKWWLTGTRTGRLSSGGEKGSSKKVNLQNIHGDPNMQNLATPDKDWRKLYKALHRIINKLYGRSVQALHPILEKLHTVSNKEKKIALNEQLKAAIKQLQMKLYNSSKFKRLCDKIVEKYGEIKVLLGFDQGQIEVRVMAQASGDKNLIKDCMSSDIHSKVGHAMTGWPEEQIKKDKKTRTLTKNIHFGILFGLGANGLMDFIKVKDPDSTIDEKEAQRLYDNYFAAYPGVRDFIDEMRAFVEANGYVENMFGFRRPLGSDALEGYEKENEGEDSGEGGAFWGNQAINTPVQGAAHQLMLMAIARLKRKRKKYKLLGVPTIEVHDYLGFKIPLKNVFKSLKLCKELLEKEPLYVVKKEFPDIKWKIPLVVEGKVGFRLGDSVECEDDKKMHELLADMYIETYIKEYKLDIDIRQVA
jgi:uracil-DNA glycosylase family 4